LPRQKAPPHTRWEENTRGMEKSKNPSPFGYSLWKREKGRKNEMYP